MYFDRRLLDAISAARREGRASRRLSRRQSRDLGAFPIRM